MFKSFFIAGFECSSHRRQDARRLDMLAASSHDRLANADYRRISELGIGSARDGLRWHLIEATPGRYDWSSFLPMLRAARDNRVQVVWDLCHYGYPDGIDIWSPDFVDRFGRFSASAARLIRDETGEAPLLCPVNEISFWAWAGAEVGRMNPCVIRRGAALKKQLVRATIAAVEAVRDGHPDARFLYAEPAIHVDGGLGSPEHRRAAELYSLSQYEAFDMISGRMAPELGGRPEHLDIVGVNFYPDNQWYLHGGTIPMGHHAYKSFSDMLAETYRRYGRPMIVAETGAEGSGRAAWLHYVMGEVAEARDHGVPVEAVCLYPILDTPAWTNDRLCPVGLFSAAEEDGHRDVYRPLRTEILAQQRGFEPRTRAGNVAELSAKVPGTRSSMSKRGSR
ncbi:MAG: beta-glucosidase [Pseudomonadota bacterium]|nr:beta-glucosidase [Pseudomonadota bacterium]